MRQSVSVSADHRVPDGFHSWLRLAICMLIGTIGGVGMWSMVVVLPAVQADFGVLRADVSLTFTLNMIGFGIGNAVIGRYLDRVGITLPLIVASIILGLGYILSSLVRESFLVFSLLQILVGTGASCAFGPILADISHWFERRRGIAIAAVAAANYVAGAVWPGIINAIVSVSDWRTAFQIIGVVCMLLIGPLAMLLRARPPATRGAQMDQPRLASNLSPRALQTILVIAGVACCVAMAMPQLHIVAYCVDLGFDAGIGAEMLSLMLVGGLISRLGFGFLADRIGGVKTVLISSSLQCLSLVLYIPYDGLASLYIVSLIFGLSQGGIVSTYALIIREYLPAREAGQRVGIVILATVVGMAFGGWMSGWIYDLTGSYRMAFLNGVAWNLLNLAMMLIILFRTRQPRTGLAGIAV